MNKSYIISGSLFGDEGKGTFVDFLASEKGIHQNVRYNGGSQASHTVQIGDKLHKFSQLGSNMFDELNKTFLSANTIVNPFNLYTEAKIFSDKTGISVYEILKKIYIDRNALVVTPYHKLIGQIKEIINVNSKRGSVGTGVSQTRRLYDEFGFGIRVKDIENITDETKRKIIELFDYTNSFVKENIDNADSSLLKKLIDSKDLYYLTDVSNKDYIIKCYENLMRNNYFNLVNNIKEFYSPKEDILMEGSQGLLIDVKYGIKPNTTLLDTTNHYGVYLSKEIDYDPIKIGASRAFSSRHGEGILPTKDAFLQSVITDPNQESNYWQGSPIYGWYDALLTRYSQSVNDNDEIFMSGLDELSSFPILKICDSYLYKGIVDENFKNIFEYVKDTEKIIITSIKNNHEDLKKYLMKCTPIYKELRGWEKDIRNITRYEDLPIECISYVEEIQRTLKTPITLLGVGPKRETKIRRLER